MNKETIQSFDLLEIVFENTHTLIAYLDKDMKFLCVNKAYASADKNEPDYFVGKGYFDLFPNEENETIFKQVVETGEPYSCFAKPFEYEHNPECEVIYWDWTLEPVKDKQGSVTNLIFHLVDVSERVKEQEELKSVSKLNEKFISESPFGISIYNHSGQCIAANSSMAKMIGATQEQVLEQNYNHISSWKKSGLLEVAIKCVNTQEKQRHEFDVKTSFGKHAFFDCLFSPLELHGEQYLSLMLDDINGRKDTEKALKESELLLEKAQHIAHVGHWKLDMGSSEITGSEELFRLFDLSKESTHVVDFIEVIHEDDREMAAAVLQRAMDLAEDWDIEYRVVHKNGDEKWVHAIGEVVTDEQGKVVQAIGTVHDITQRKLAVKEFERFFDLSKNMVGTGNLEGYFTRINSSFKNILGYETEELLAKPFIEFVYEKDIEKTIAVLNEAITGKNDLYIENRYRCKDGSIKWIEWNILALAKENKFYSYGRDVTERKCTEEALKTASELNQRIINESPIGLAIYDQTGQCIAANNSVAKMIGATQEQMLKQNYNEVASWKKSGLYDKAKQCLRSQEKMRHEFDVLTTFGKRAFFDGQLVAFTLHDEQHLLLMLDDISERKSSEMALKESEAMLEEAQRIAHVGSWEWIAETGTPTWSKELCAILEVDPDKPIPTIEEQHKIYTHESMARMTSAVENSMQTGESYEIELERVREDGTRRCLLARGEPMYDERGDFKGLRGTALDITSRKAAEAELSKHRHHLEELVDDRTKELRDTQDELVRKERLATLGQLTATVSHELRNPLGAMRPSLFIIEKKSDKEDERLQSAIERIDRNIDRCDHIIDELLSFTRITELDLEPIQIDKWLEIVIEEQVIPEGINIEKEFGLKNIKILIDTDRLRRAMINVMENAYHSMMDDNQQLVKNNNSYLKIKTITNNENVEIKITDNGCGIKKDNLNKVFEPLFSTKSFGVGLGMPTIKQILQQHGGDIDVESEEGKGTTVTLWLPCNMKGKDTGVVK